MDKILVFILFDIFDADRLSEIINPVNDHFLDAFKNFSQNFITNLIFLQRKISSLLPSK